MSGAVAPAAVRELAPTNGAAASRAMEVLRPSQAGVTLSIVIPTFNEAGNIGELLRRIDACLQGVRWEVLVVDDDSADGTADLVLAMGACDERIRCLRRVGRRGLSSACLEGMAVARGQYYVVMDADLQHDEQLLPVMLQVMSGGLTDLVVGSRYLAGGGVDDWSPTRVAMSRLATLATQVLLSVGLSDPMSGFFMIRAEVLRQVSARVSGKGFKLLLDLVASSRVPLRVVELPYRFAIRHSGQSKLDAGVVSAFLLLLARKLPGRLRSRFGKFSLIGGSGVLVHLAVLYAMQGLLLASFPAAQTGAVIVSMISNFSLNNRLTYPDRRLHGARFMSGLSRFSALCAVGAVVNVALAEALHRSGVDRMTSAAAGILGGAVCNYLSTSAFVWRS